jgi:hypothetical protein
MNAVLLYRIDSARRMQRFYRMDVQPDLFGQRVALAPCRSFLCILARTQAPAKCSLLESIRPPAPSCAPGKQNSNRRRPSRESEPTAPRDLLGI